MFNTDWDFSRRCWTKLAAASRKVDRRTLKTRAALLTVFRELVLLHGYAAVAVGDIVRQANIGHSTFYLHFSSKRELLKHSLEGPCAGLAACVDGGSAPERLSPLLKHFHEQRHINRVFFEDPLRSIWVGCLASTIERKLRGTPGHARSHRTLPVSLVASTIAEMQIAMIIHWLKRSGSVSPERMAMAILTSTRALLSSSTRAP